MSIRQSLLLTVIATPLAAQVVPTEGRYLVHVVSTAEIRMGEQVQPTRLAVEAVVRLDRDAGGGWMATLEGVEIEPTTTSTFTFAASRRADTGATYRLASRGPGRPARPAVDDDAGPVARFLLQGVDLVLPRDPGVSGVVDTAATTFEDAYSQSQSLTTLAWRRNATAPDSLTGTLTGQSSSAMLDGSSSGTSEDRGTAWMVLGERGVLRAGLESTSTSENVGTAGTARREGQVRVRVTRLPDA